MPSLFKKKDKQEEEKKKKQDASGKVNMLCEKLPYEFTPSYIYHNGRCATIVQLYVRSGSNRQLTFQEIIDMIPTNAFDGVQMYFIVQDSMIKYDTKKRIIRQNAGSNKETINDTQKHGRKEETDDVSEYIMQEAEKADYDDYERILDSAEPIAVFKIQLMISGPTPEVVEEQLQTLNTIFDQRHEGAKWDSLAGDQSERFQSLFQRLEHTRFDMTSTASNYAGLDFAVNSGLADPGGVPIGVDALSLTASTAFFDFETYTSKQAFIAMPHSSVMGRFMKEDSNVQVSASSLIAQCAANQIAISGHRVKHIVLNDFDYFEKGLYYRPAETEQIFKVYDASTMTINPLQGFGDVEDVVKIFSRLTQKIVNIFDLLEDLKLTQEEKAVVLTAIERFYFNHGLWTVDAEIHPKRTRIVGISKPETYPTLGMLVHEFTTLAQSAARDNRELKADRVDTLKSILSQALSSHMGVLGRPTSIKDSDALQTYFDFNNIESRSMTQVQFINMLDYIIYTCRKGDCIVIHGCEKLYDTTMKMVAETIKAAQRRGVRMIFSYDTIVAQDSQVDKMSDIFKMQGPYYVDLETDVDWSYVGKMTNDEVKMYEKAMNTYLSDIIRSQAAAKLPCQALVHRSAGNINNFVHMNVLV